MAGYEATMFVRSIVKMFSATQQTVQQSKIICVYKGAHADTHTKCIFFLCY